MIIVVLKGGLGNQLFQYACARALSLRNGEPVKFDITGYARTINSDTPREYLLSHFNIHDEQIASDEEVQAFKYPHGNISKGWRMIRTKLGLHNVGWVPRILRKKGDAYLDGFWQTERYFLPCQDAIRKELTLREPFGAAARAVAEEIAGKNASSGSGASHMPAVSLHVRRGDVARDAKTNAYYGITTPEYYARALARMAEEIARRNGQARFRVFVFSDDIEWVRKNIPIPYPTTYVSAGGAIPDYQELLLMSMCDHHIIANSSFSWWGAWLDPRPDKIVIAPKRWITVHEFRHRHTVPPSWIRI